MASSSTVLEAASGPGAHTVHHVRYREVRSECSWGVVASETRLPLWVGARVLLHHGKGEGG